MWTVVLITALGAVVLLMLSVFINVVVLRAGAILVGMMILSILAFVVGKSAERLKHYDQYTFHILRYSSHLRMLAEQNKLRELTNAIVVFDQRFTKRQSPVDLSEAVFEVLRLE